MPNTLCAIANQYSRYGIEHARVLYHQIIGGYPEYDRISTCQLQLARLNIWELIETGNFAAADSAISKMKSDFTDNTFLLNMLNSIANRYITYNMARSKALYQQMITEYPQSERVTEFQIQLAKFDIWKLMDSGDFADTETAIAQMKSDFADNTILPNMLYGIANRYTRYDVERSQALYQQIVDEYPEYEHITRCELRIAKLDIWQLLDSGDFTAVDIAAVPVIFNWIFPKYT